MNPISKTDAVADVDHDWWRGAIIYQIYPRSFQDSNGDGIGDLLGIVNRMPYVASLGVDAIWISPFFTSPMKDFGYDVSDYCDVDPMFGTLGDFDALIKAAHQSGIKVMIDLVLSHTSDDHDWFKESRQSHDNDKSDWYVWADAKEDGTPPNNWLSIFGGPAWQWDARREQYFLHNFLASQPDLNFHEIQVQNELLETARFWLDRGVDGFRLDTINFYFADKMLRDNPALPKDQRNNTIAPSVNPYNHQEHLYSKNQPENIEFLKRFRAVLDEYPAATIVGEVGDAQKGLELLGEYTSGDKRVHMCYAFEFLASELLTPARIVSVMKRLETAAPDGWACWAFSNHDVMRHATRWNLSEPAKRLYTTMMMALRGSLCLYQGEELGLSEADVSYDDLQDPYGIEFWPEFKGRDGCRTPMVWENSNLNAGFTSGRPWLPVNSGHFGHAAHVQEDNPASLLHHYRRVIAFRQSHKALVKGTYEHLSSSDNVLHFHRVFDGEWIFCAFNLSDHPSVLDMPTGEWHPIGTEFGAIGLASDGKVHMDPWQPCFLLLKS